MKILILAIAVVTAFPGFARARVPDVRDGAQHRGPTVVASSAQKAGVLKLSMGPTSAPHKPGGTGDQTSNTTQSGKKPKHHHTRSSSPN